NTGDEMNTCAGIPDLRAGDHGKAVDLTRGGCSSTCALRHIFVNLAVLERAGTESFDRRINHAWIDLLNSLPRESHAIYRARRDVFNHDVTALDELREDLRAGIRLGIERHTPLVAVQHREIKTVDAGDIA